MGRLLLISMLLWGCAGHGVLGSEGADPGVLPDLAPPSAKPQGDGTCRGYVVSSIRGKLLAEDGTGYAGARAQLCVREGTSDRLTCLRPEEADANGDFQVTVPDDTRCIGAAAMRVLAPGEPAAVSYCTLDLSGGPAVTLPEPLIIYSTRSPRSLPPADGSDQRAHTVDFGQGLQVDVVPGRLYGGSGSPYDALTARRVDPGSPGLCFPDAVAGFDGLYAFSPEADVDGEGLSLRIATDEPPLTAVALYVLGGLGCTDAAGELIPEAGWMDFGTGIVGDDGYIHVGGDSGLPCLSWLGYRVIRRGEDRAPPPPGAVPPEDERDDPPLSQIPPAGGGDGDPAPPPPDPGEEDAPPVPPPSDPPADPPADPPPTDPPPANPPPANPPAGGDCVYPPAAGINLGGTMPDVEWPDAVDESGNRVGFSLRAFHCDPAYERYSVVAFVVSTGWCSACPQYLRQVASQAQAIRQAGGLLVIEESEDSGYNPIDSPGAARFLDRLIGNAPGLRVGGGSSRPSVQLLARSNIVQAYPAAFVVRRRDMRVIAELRSAPGGMPIDQIAANPDRDWGAGADAPPRCGPADEEPQEPNNSAAQAGALAAGQSVSGGVCGADMDFYRVNHAGSWTLDLRFRHADGDLDVYVWDTARNAPLQNGNQRVGSDSNTDNESFSYQGPATIAVVGYRGATARYTLALTGR
ncbi:MAG: hypothetical protein H6706_13580 [Myxococcales bacterium]|nr:hypothetical protein [Myxococcales bacterium]